MPQKKIMLLLGWENEVKASIKKKNDYCVELKMEKSFLNIQVSKMQGPVRSFSFKVFKHRSQDQTEEVLT